MSANLDFKIDFKKFASTKYGVFLYCLTISFLLLLICSRSSFLYPYNDWNDANSYFSMGKSILNGKIPYRDVFDQKGLYLYLLYGIAYLISHTDFTGVFLLEVLFCAFSLYGAFQILLLYLKEKTARILLPLFGGAAFSSHSFYWGGSAEEFCLPFFMWVLFLSLRYFRRQYPAPLKLSVVFTAGLFAGIIAMIKYNGLGFFFGFMMMAALSFLLRKDWVGLVKSVLVFLGGMLITIFPILLYFLIKGALYDMYWAYLYVNIFVYGHITEQGPALGERISALVRLLYWVMIKNLPYSIFIFLGIGKICFSKRNLSNPRLWLETVNLISLFFFLFLGIYIGGSELPYYALPFCVFAIVGFAAAFRAVDFHPANHRQPGKLLAPLLPAVSIGISLLLAYRLSMNTDYMNTPKESHFLYQFQTIIAETPKPTLLNIGCLDAGLYTVCDILPTCRWFQGQYLPIPDVTDTHLQFITEGRTDYVLARDSYPDAISEQYELAAQAPYIQDGQTFTYFLFRKKDMAEK